jgi:glyoxylase-like metal-dependent hydrolase (beta-lactamase superfamily II)
MSAEPLKPEVKGFLHGPTHSVSYVVRDPGSSACVVIDPVLDIDQAAGRLSTGFADGLIAFIREHSLRVSQVFETHIHADHLSAAAHLRRATGAEVAIGSGVSAMQDHFAGVFGQADFPQGGEGFDRLLADGEPFLVGGITGRALHTPGHTPACMTYVIGDAVFVGDTLFMPDSGTARADFPGGDARLLYRSIKHILTLPEEFRIFVCHDYGPNGRAVAWETTVAEQRRANIHVHDGINEDAFVALRTSRDATLSAPQLIIPAIQINLRAGDPPADQQGRRFLSFPLDAF